MTRSERNDLLFALVALRNGIVSEKQMIDALEEWTRHETRRLCDVLIHRGDITNDEFHYLNELSADCKTKTKSRRQPIPAIEAPLVVVAS